MTNEELDAVRALLARVGGPGTAPAGWPEPTSWSLEHACKALLAEVTELRDVVDARGRVIGEDNARIDALCAEVAELRAERDALKEDVEFWSVCCRGAEAEGRRLLARVAELEDEVSRLRAARDWGMVK